MLTNEPRLEACMARAGLDALVGTSPENVTYLSGFWAMTQWIGRGPQDYVLRPAPGKGEASIIAETGTLDLVADQQPWVEKVRRHGYFQADVSEGAELDDLDQRQKALYGLPEFPGPVEALVDAIRHAGLERGRIGVDEMGITPQAFARLREMIPEARIEFASELLRQVRAIKLPEEVRRLRRACNIAEESIDASLKAARAGMTEMEMARIFHTTTVQNDAEPVLCCIGFGTRSALVNAQPSGTARLKEGDIIRFDVGGRYRYYRADIARIGILGEPAPRVREIYDALRAGVDHGYGIIRPGLAVSELYEQVMEAVRKKGLSHYKRSHVGHGIGLDGYDVPSINPKSQERLEAGMVICLETPYYEIGLGGLQVEDMIHVTETGADSLMMHDTALRIV